MYGTLTDIQSAREEITATFTEDRIERPVPTTDESCNDCAAECGARHPHRDGHHAMPSPHPPTREQIAEAKALIEEADGALSVIGDGDWTWQDTMLRRLADHYRKLLALIQNGADRG
jgi:thiamine pyrophosphate-dependent acetolactate synthase large subunit-like protein